MDNYDIKKVATEVTDLITPNRDLTIGQDQILTDLVNATTKEELRKQIELFNLNQSKKNAVKILKLEQLQNKVEDKIIERFDKRPDQLSNKELLEYWTTVSGQIDRSQKVVDSIEEKEMEKHIMSDTFNPNGNSTTNYNINLGTDLNKDNKDNVVNAIKDILSLLQSNDTEMEYNEIDPNIEEVEVIKEN